MHSDHLHVEVKGRKCVAQKNIDLDVRVGDDVKDDHVGVQRKKLVNVLGILLILKLGLLMM